MAKVDIIIPYFNTFFPYIEAALKSVLDQSFKNWTAIVVNDGSEEQYTIELETLLEAYQDDRIIYIKTTNQGLAAARNNGIKASDSPYVAFLDSDDMWSNYTIEKQLAAIESSQKPDIVFGGVEHIDANGCFIKRSIPKTFVNTSTPQTIFERMMTGNFIGISSSMVRRVSLEGIGLFCEELMALEDKDLWLRLLYYGARLHYIDDVLLYYRIHSTNMMKDSEKMHRYRIVMISRLGNMIKECSSSSIDVKWSKWRRLMIQNAFIELSQGLYMQKKYGRSLLTCLPIYSGFSAQSIKWLIKCCFQLLRLNSKAISCY